MSATGPIKVALDATPLVSGRTGIAAYITELAAELPRHGVDPLLFAVGRARHPVPPGCRRFRLPSRVVHRSWSIGGPPRAECIAGGHPELIHATGLLPPTSRRPVVATVHDLAALEQPDLHPERSVRQLRALVAGLRRATVVLAVSEATAQVVVAHGVASERVVVTPLGRRWFGPPSAVGRVATPYLLAVGEQMARKGIDVALEALASAPDLPDLVHAGPEGAATDTLRRTVERLGLGARVRFLGFVAGPDLARLVADADALVFPSRAEGFGLPVLEAMAARTPVVASDLAVLREVGGDTVTYVPAGDPGALAAALVALAGDDERRAALVAAARQRAAGFTWARCAALTAGAYRLALGVDG